MLHRKVLTNTLLFIYPRQTDKYFKKLETKTLMVGWPVVVYSWFPKIQQPYSPAKPLWTPLANILPLTTCGRYNYPFTSWTLSFPRHLFSQAVTLNHNANVGYDCSIRLEQKLFTTFILISGNSKCFYGRAHTVYYTKLILESIMVYFLAQYLWLLNG